MKRFGVVQLNLDLLDLDSLRDAVIPMGSSLQDAIIPMGTACKIW